ncbi:MAG TPA: type B 50S ribosomal protein L31 [Candidatus Rhabdochlamydia sp.]|jgi:large subunit ribosomal protein L31|nr:type B 50S ribosomal protein L31 [Candidatus Rhabdochlamydia sp.]
MKKKGHPLYQEVLFVDSTTGFSFVCGSTLQTKERQVYEGKEYPVYRAPITSASHPFFTKDKKLVDSEGRVGKFVNRYAKKVKPKQEENIEVVETKISKKVSPKKTKKT